MLLEQIRHFVIKETEEKYLINFWNSKSQGFKVLDRKDDPIWQNLNSLISKIMEFYRVCLEDGDSQPEIWLNKNFNDCQIKLIKKNGQLWKYQLYPYGFQGNWEIFNVEKTISDTNSC